VGEKVKTTVFKIATVAFILEICHSNWQYF